MVGQNQPATEIRANEWQIRQPSGQLVDQHSPSHWLGRTTARNLKNDISDLQSPRCKARIGNEALRSALSTGCGPISKLGSSNYSNGCRLLRLNCGAPHPTNRRHHDMANRGGLPPAWQFPQAASALVSSSMSAVRRSPKTWAALPIPPCSTNGVYSNDSGAIPSSVAMFSFIHVSHCN